MRIEDLLEQPTDSALEIYGKSIQVLGRTLCAKAAPDAPPLGQPAAVFLRSIAASLRKTAAQLEAAAAQAEAMEGPAH